MTTTTGMAAALRYVRAVEAELDDLPGEDRAELLEDVEQHVAEVAAEGEHPLEQRLGPPAAFAAELRAAAGLPPRSGAGESLAVRAARRVAASPGARVLGRASEQVAAHPAYAAVRRFLPELRPAWWVLRGYLAVGVPAWLTTGGESERGVPIPAPFGSELAGLLLLAVAIPVSVRLGRRPAGRRRLPRVALNAALALAAVFFAFELPSRSAVEWVTYSGHSDVAVGPFGVVTDIYAYDAAGNRLDDVRLYDQYGNPLDYVRDEGRPMRLRYTASGDVVTNAFPRHYPSPDDVVTAEPTAGPPERVPPLLGASPSVTPSVSPSPSKRSPKPKRAPAPSPTPSPTPSPRPTG